MSDSLIIEGKKFYPATTAGKRFGYTKDYLLLLIKKGSIDGKKVGNKWYVHLESAQTFFDDADRRKMERKRELSNARKNELKRHSRVRTSSTHKTALLETLAIVVIGLTLGATGYVGVESQPALLGDRALSFFERFAISIYATVEGDSLSKVGVKEDQRGGGSDAEVRTVEDVGEGIVVLPGETFDEDAVATVRESFSDPVSVQVDPEHPDTGVIVPEFKHGEGEEYRFLMVPVVHEERGG